MTLRDSHFHLGDSLIQNLMRASDRWMFTMSDHSDTNLDAGQHGLSYPSVAHLLMQELQMDGAVLQSDGCKPLNLE